MSGGRTRQKRLTRLAAARVYLCVGARPDLASLLDVVLAAGVDIVQLREKGLEARDELALLEVVAAAARRHDALWAVNDRADLAAVAGADVLHVGQGDLPVQAARQVVGPDVLIGLSTHAEAEVDLAATEPGVDYFCVGPTWPTPTKPGRPAPGLALTRYAARIAPAGAGRPWFAIGGVEPGARLAAVVAAGAGRVVVVRALTEAADPGAATRGITAALPQLRA